MKHLVYERRRFLGALVAASLLLWLPGSSSASSSQAAPSVVIVQPQPDATVPGPDVTIEVRVEGAVLGGRSRQGAHLLLRLDDLPPMKSYAPRFTFRGLSAGEHRIAAELRRADGEPFDPPSTAAVTFTVAAGSAVPSP